MARWNGAVAVVLCFALLARAASGGRAIGLDGIIAQPLPQPQQSEPAGDVAQGQTHPFLGWYDDSEKTISQDDALEWYQQQRLENADLLDEITVEYDRTEAEGFDALEHNGCRDEAWCLSAARSIDVYGLAHVVAPSYDPYAISGSAERWDEIKAAGLKAEKLVTERLNQIAGEDVCYNTPHNKGVHEFSWKLADTAMRTYHRLDSLLGIEGILTEFQTAHAIFSIADEVLNGTARILDVGIVNGLPGAEFQLWHEDYGEQILSSFALGMRRTSGFPFAVNVFIPLVDMAEDLGPPEFSVRDHLSTCELPDEQVEGSRSNETHFTVHYAAYSAWMRWKRWWHCLWVQKDKVRGDVPPQFQERLKTRLTLRPDMTGRPNSFFIYDYLAWHRATPNYSPNLTRPALYVLMGRQGFKDNANFNKNNFGLFDRKAETFLRKFWEVEEAGMEL
ncbi:hypothetical protein FOA52_006454 [Chlamydomonas sp. UWO 241]|nr:hypothetical protein FOA52_006454 [Chlamydomonas sp. UWO 241]